MQIEFIESGSQDCPLIRIFDGSSSEYRCLHDALEQLASGEPSTAVLNELPGFRPINCNLTARVGKVHRVWF